MSNYLALMLIVDLGAALVARPLGHYLRHAFSHPALSNAIWFALAYVAFCAAIWLARRLPHDQDAFASEPSLRRPAGWSALSVMLGTVTLIFAAPHVSLGQTRLTLPPGFFYKLLEILGGWLVVALIFLPLVLAWAGTPEPLARHKRGLGELLALVLSAATFVVTKSYFEWLMLDQPGSDASALDPRVIWSWVAIVFLVPLFLVMFGGPRLVLLARRFSLLEAVILVASTALYFLSGFAF